MFDQYKLDIQILRTLQRLGLTQPTPIQEKAMPLILEGRDVISLAETGSGKTIAYLAPTLTHLLQAKDKCVLILSPTRELSTQINTVVHDLTVYSPGMPSALLIGGLAMSQQVRALKKNPQILVATPGRLMDHVRQRTVDLKKVTHLVLDEADRMFDMGFAPQVNEIVRYLPQQRQTMLFSATFSKEVRALADRILRSPIEIEVRKNDRPPVTITQKVIEVAQADKNEKTLDLINEAKGSIVIFTRTKHRTDRLAQYLAEYGVKVARIHGDRSQGQRNKSISDFKSGAVKVLVATDIAARGLDVSNVTDVINFDIPQNADDYVHRIGRTGRAGQEGQSLTLVTREDRNDWNYIANKMKLPFIGTFDGKKPPGRHGHQRPGGGGKGQQARGGQAQGINQYGNKGGPKPSSRKPFSGSSGGGHKKSSGHGQQAPRPSQCQQSQRPAQGQRPTQPQKPAQSQRPAQSHNHAKSSPPVGRQPN